MTAATKRKLAALGHPRELKPMVASISSSNLHYYGERAPEAPGRVWCEVLVDSLTRVGGGWLSKPIPDYRVRVYVSGVGAVGEMTYTPSRRPSPVELSPRTVARLVREVLR